jgi:hypothetical protein
VSFDFDMPQNWALVNRDNLEKKDYRLSGRLRAATPHTVASNSNLVSNFKAEFRLVFRFSAEDPDEERQILNLVYDLLFTLTA